MGAPPPHHHRPRLAPHPPHQHHLQRAPPSPPYYHGQRDNQLDPPLDPHHHPPPDPYLDQTQECILVTQQWVRRQQAVADPQLKRHHPPVVYTLGTLALVLKVCKRVMMVPALAPRGQARSPVEVGPETWLQHMRMDPPALPVVHPLLVIHLLVALRRGWIQ
nr:hypothetical protein [Tanacetum cinerariifolium]